MRLNCLHPFPLGSHMSFGLVSFLCFITIVSQFEIPKFIFISLEKICTDWTVLSMSTLDFVNCFRLSMNSKWFTFPLPIQESCLSFGFCSISLKWIIPSTNASRDTQYFWKKPFLLFHIRLLMSSSTSCISIVLIQPMLCSDLYVFS